MINAQQARDIASAYEYVTSIPSRPPSKVIPNPGYKKYKLTIDNRSE